MASDDFNRADGPLGPNWATVGGSPAIVSNGFGGAVDDNIARWIADTFADDQYAEVVIRPTDALGGPAVRCRSDGSCYMISTGFDSTELSVLYRRPDGGNNFVGGLTGLSMPSSIVLGVEIVGTSLQVYIDDVPVGSPFSVSNNDSGQPGIFSYGSYSPLDNWFAEDVGGGGDQTLNPSLLTRSKTIYTPTVTRGAVTISPSLVTRSKTLYTPTVTSVVTLQPPLVTRSRSLYAPSVTVGAVSVLPPLVSRSKSLFAPTVTPGSVTISPGLLTRSKTMYAPTVSVGL